MKDLEVGKVQHGRDVKSIFWDDGNTILMKTKDLLKLLDYCRNRSPNLKRVTMYGSGQYINLKSLDELIKLKKLGYLEYIVVWSQVIWYEKSHPIYFSKRNDRNRATFFKYIESL